MEGSSRLDRLIPWAMVLLVTAVAVFAFVQSYTHIYSLGQMHHQTGASLRMLPLSVDWLMLAAGLVMLHLGRKEIRHPLPRTALITGAIATLTANIADGIIWGWESAMISAWAPVVLFIVVELGMLVVRTAKAKPRAVEDGPVAGPSVETMERIMANLPTEKSPRPVPPGTELRPPQASPEPSRDTTTMRAVTDSPPAPAGWGQLAGQEPAGGLTGIGLNNGRKQ